MDELAFTNKLVDVVWISGGSRRSKQEALLCVVVRISIEFSE